MSSRRKDPTLKEKVNVIEYVKVNKWTQLEHAKKVSDIPSSSFNFF